MGRARAVDLRALEDIARELFWTRGYGRTSMDDIARAADVGNGSIYAAYENKHALFLTVLERYCAGRVTTVVDALDGRATIKDAVSSLLTAIIDDCATQPERRGCLMLNSLAELGDADDSVRELCARTTAAMEAAVFDKLAAVCGLVRGDVRYLTLEARLDVLAAQIIMVAQGLIQMSRLGVARARLVQVAESYQLAVAA